MADFISVLAVASALALLPTMLYALLLWWLDRYEKEPIPLLLVAFAWGAIPAVVLALGLEVVAGIPLRGFVLADQAREIAETSFVAPVVEEVVKAAILVALFLIYKREFDDVLDGVVYGAMVGLGFALVENVFYFMSSAYEAGAGGRPQMSLMFAVWISRAGLFGLNHSMFTAFTGAALGLARSLHPRWQRTLVPALGLGVAILLHGVHNNLVSRLAMSADGTQPGLVVGIFTSDWGGVLVILAVAIISGIREAGVIRATLWEEVALGRFTPDEYATLMSGTKRMVARWSALLRLGFRQWLWLGHFFDLATELAFRKHHMADGDLADRTLSARDIARLRGQIDNLRTAVVPAE